VRINTRDNKLKQDYAKRQEDEKVEVEDEEGENTTSRAYWFLIWARLLIPFCRSHRRKAVPKSRSLTIHDVMKLHVEFGISSGS